MSWKRGQKLITRFQSWGGSFVVTTFDNKVYYYLNGEEVFPPFDELKAKMQADGTLAKDDPYGKDDTNDKDGIPDKGSTLSKDGTPD